MTDSEFRGGRPWSARLLPGCVLSALVCLVLVAPGAVAASERSGALAHVQRWGYQLQNINLGWLANSPHDLLVIDFSSDGGTEGAFSKRDIERIRRKPDGSRRIVLAYLSIGEAETYRDYWRWYWGGSWYGNILGWVLAPDWVGSENRQWRGNFAVRYWEEGWQQRILGEDGYLERILAAGFDGVYLDKVDSSLEKVAKRRPSAKDDMRTFVRRIAEKGRSARPGFVVVPQNGEELLDDAGYVAVIDGIAKEDLLYGEFKDGEPNPEKVIARRHALFGPLTAAGKTVLAVEYLDNARDIAKARERLEGFGFVPYFGDRGLNTLRYGDLPETAR
jgi:cysteinyl-tRNA synthetase